MALASLPLCLRHTCDNVKKHRNNGRVIGCHLPNAISGKAGPFGRRQLISSLLTATATATAVLFHSHLSLNSAAAAAVQQGNQKNDFIHKLLERSNANKAKYDKERLDSYYKRSYKDYFEFVEGSVQNKKGNLSEAEKEILEWLRKNR